MSDYNGQPKVRFFNQPPLYRQILEIKVLEYRSSFMPSLLSEQILVAVVSVPTVVPARERHVDRTNLVPCSIPLSFGSFRLRANLGT